MKSFLQPLSAALAGAAARLVLAARFHPRSRRRLGQVFRLAQECAHELDVREAQSRYPIHPTVTWGLDTIFHGPGEIAVGERTYFGRDCFIVADPETTKITVGRHCAISHNVHIRTARHQRVFHLRDERALPASGGDITIGDDVWIGANVYIAGGVTIGDNSIIGANSVVISDVAANTVVAGTPARLIREKSEYLGTSGPEAP